VDISKAVGYRKFLWGLGIIVVLIVILVIVSWTTGGHTGVVTKSSQPLSENWPVGLNTIQDGPVLQAYNTTTSATSTVMVKETHSPTNMISLSTALYSYFNNLHWTVAILPVSDATNEFKMQAVNGTSTAIIDVVSAGSAKNAGSLLTITFIAAK